MLTKKGHSEIIYINEIIRITYKCNWRCKFCNVLKTNNFGDTDVTSKEVIIQILNLAKKYTSEQRKKLILSFSGGEPTLDKNLVEYIKLAKKIGIGVVEIQTNGTKLFKNKEYIWELIDAGLNEIFLAQHSGDDLVNKELGIIYNIDDFVQWTKYIIDNNIHKKVSIYLNIVISKINIFSIYKYIELLIKIGFIEIIPTRKFDYGKVTHKISFGFVQPNGYAEINKNEVLMKYTEEEINEISKIVNLCQTNDILPDFHFVCPPLCILNYPEYNLEYERLKKLEKDKINGITNDPNLDSYKYLWKEKRKYKECVNCKYNNYCLGFYNNWIEFVGDDYVIGKINNFLANYTEETKGLSDKEKIKIYKENLKKIKKDMELANELKNKGKYKEAEELYLEDLKLDPHNVTLLKALGFLYVFIGEEKKAEKYISKEEIIQGIDNRETLIKIKNDLDLVNKYKEQGRHKEAEELLLKDLEIYPNHKGIKEGLDLLYK